MVYLLIYSGILLHPLYFSCSSVSVISIPSCHLHSSLPLLGSKTDWLSLFRPSCCSPGETEAEDRSCIQVTWGSGGWLPSAQLLGAAFCSGANSWSNRLWPGSRADLLYKTRAWRTSLVVVQWLRIHLALQGTRVRSLVWGYSTCHGAMKP